MKTIGAIALFACLAAAQTPDYKDVKHQTEMFETVLNTAVRQHFDQPFLMLQEPKGAYLQGYGVVFTLEVSLYPMRLRTPFAAAPYTDKEVAFARAQKQARIKDMEDLIRDLMRDHGMAMNFLGPDDTFAVVVHLNNQAEHRDMPSQLIVRVKQQVLQEAASRKLNAAEFRQKLSIQAY